MMSLLFKSDTHNTGEIIGAENLMLHEFLKNTFCSEETSIYVADILCKPLLETEDIQYRSEFIRAFYNDKNSFNDLLKLYERFEQLSRDWDKVKKDYTTLMHTEKGNAEAYAAWNYLKESIRYMMKINAGFVRQSVLTDRIYAACESAGKSDFCSSVKQFGNFTSHIINLFEQNKSYITSIYESMYENISAQIYISLDDMANVLSVMLQEVNVHDIHGDFRKHCKDTDSISHFDAENILNEAVRYTNRIIITINDGFFNLFISLKKELQFYWFAVRYMQILYDKKTDFVFPSVTENINGAYVENLTDPFLLVKSNEKEIVPRDINLKLSDSAIMTGANNTGKTCYLRSIVYAQIFAQAGLPVPSTHASLTIRKNIFLVFAAREIQKKTSNVGLFEQDVIEMAEVIHKAEPHDIVFLNEIFQSTFYEEAANALYNIFKYFTRKDIQFFAVTHIEGLLNRLKNENREGIIFLEAQNDYKIKLKL